MKAGNINPENLIIQVILVQTIGNNQSPSYNHANQSSDS